MRALAVVTASALCIGLASCGGGGGGGGSSAPGGGTPVTPATTSPTSVPTAAPSGLPTVAPTAAPTASATPSPAAATAAATTITIDSNPRGLPVTLDGAALGSTPATAAPAFGRSAHTIAIAGGATPYVVTFAPPNNGPKTIFYNAQMDTAAKIAAIVPSVAQRVASAAMLPVVRRMATSGVRGRAHARAPLGSTPVYPNDTHFTASEQWSLFRIGMPEAWGYATGRSGIAIAVIDTGYDPGQPDVAGAVTVAERISGGRIDASPGAASDTDGHGTFLSGIAAAVTNNAAGWAGVSYGAALQEYKVFGDGPAATADSGDVALAVREAIAHNANVILLALGGPPDSPDPIERDAVAAAIAAGITVVAGSGNDGATVSALDFPAGYDGVIAVGASALDDTAIPGTATGAREYVPAYSNAGAGLALVAPGGDPASASDVDPIHWIANAYTTRPFAGTPACAAGTAAANCGALFSGTSAAAAHVAGAAALLLAKNAAQTPAAVAALLRSSADDIGDRRAGSGRLDVRRAMAAVTGDASPFPSYVPASGQLVAFAYTNLAAGATRPAIADLTFPRGVPVAADGTFRIADVPATTGPYRIAVWYDANGNGVVDTNDFIGVSNVCAPGAACTGASTISVARVPAGYTLP